MPIREKGKLCDLGMVFKQSFMCLQKKNLYSSDSKTRIFVLSEYLYII